MILWPNACRTLQLLRGQRDYLQVEFCNYLCNVISCSWHRKNIKINVIAHNQFSQWWPLSQLVLSREFVIILCFVTTTYFYIYIYAALWTDDLKKVVPQDRDSWRSQWMAIMVWFFNTWKCVMWWGEDYLIGLRSPCESHATAEINGLDRTDTSVFSKPVFLFSHTVYNNSITVLDGMTSSITLLRP